jgi:anti-anti-sigma factor
VITDDQSEVHLTVTMADPSGAACRIEVSGELDLAGSDALESALATVPEGMALVIDLSGIEFIDSSGIRTLILTRNHRETTLVNPSRAVRHTFEIANVLHLLETT